MKSSDNNDRTIIGLAIIWPFAGLIASLSNWRKPWAMNVFWLVCVYLGAITIFLPDGTILGDGADSGRYVLFLIQMHSSNITLGDIFANFQQDQRYMDLYQQLTTFLVSRFTDNGHVLFALWAFVFGFFYSRNIWYILNKISNRDTHGFFLLLALFFLTCNITEINGVRMWTALHIYVYAMMPYLVDKDRSKLWLLFVTPLVHFSYLYIVILSIMFIVYFNRRTLSKLWIISALILFIATMFVNSISLDAVSSTLQQYSPESYEGRISGYVNEDVALARTSAAAKNNWYVAANGLISQWFLNLFLILVTPIILKTNRDSQNHTIPKLFLFALLIGSFANITAHIPSGGRFLLVANMFKVSLLLLVLTDTLFINSSLYRLYKYGSYALIIPFVVQVRMFLGFYGITLIFGNFFTMFFFESNYALIQYLRVLVL